eukprot:scaffold17066_cov44-Attheya_sp.AAC.5
MADEEPPDPGKNEPESGSVISHLELFDDDVTFDLTFNSVAEPENFTTMATTLLTDIPPENILTSGRSSESICSMDTSSTQNVSFPVNLPDHRPPNDPNDSGPPEGNGNLTDRYHTKGRRPQMCNRCMKPRKGHTCPFKEPPLKNANPKVKATWMKIRDALLRKKHESGRVSRKRGKKHEAGKDSRKRGKYYCPDCGELKAQHLCEELVNKVMATIKEDEDKDEDTEENDDPDLKVDGEDEPGIDKPHWPRDDDDDDNGFSDPSGGPIAV